MNGYIGWGRRQITYEEYERMMRNDTAVREALRREQEQFKEVRAAEETLRRYHEQCNK